MNPYQSYVATPNWKTLEGQKLEIVRNGRLTFGKAENGVLYLIARVEEIEKDGLQ